MKKTFFFFIIVLFALGTLSAQGFGLKGGVNFGKFVGKDVKEISDELDEVYNIGYGGGVFFSFPMEPIDFRIEALYQQNGAKYEAEEEGASASISTQLNWVDIPVLVGVKVGLARVFVGPYFDFFLGGKSKVEFSYGGQSFDEEDDIEADDLQSFNYGVIGGVALGIGTMELEVRYSQGLNTLYKETNEGMFDEEVDVKPSMIQALLNIYIGK